LREVAGERLLVVYNNYSSAANLDIPIENTPLESAHRLSKIFGDSEGEITSGRARFQLQPRALAIYDVR
jgi:hypothetical protein